MRFSEDGICELSSITSVDECDAYIWFLGWDERPRHQLAKQLAEIWVSGARHMARAFPLQERFWYALAEFRYSAIARHQQDLDGITKRIKEIEAHRATLEVK